MARSANSICRCVCFVIGLVLIGELILLNVLIISGYLLIKGTISPILDSEGSSWLDKLSVSPTFRWAVSAGKDGGFASVIRETLGRVYIYSEPSLGSQWRQEPRLNFIGLDVSHAGEALYIYKRIHSRTTFPYSRLVVDIGANDGLLSSNSYNFIQWGWSAVLVEPQQSQLALAKKNLQPFIDPYKDGNQTVSFVNAVIGAKDTMVDFVIATDMVSMESHILQDRDHANIRDKFVVKIRSLSVSTFAQEQGIPKKFGILSIDAEGAGNQILHQWIEHGFHPGFIIYEDLFERRHESTSDTVEYLRQKGYKYMTKLGWNLIFEHTKSSL